MNQPHADSPDSLVIATTRHGSHLPTGIGKYRDVDVMVHVSDDPVPARRVSRRAHLRARCASASSPIEGTIA